MLLKRKSLYNPNGNDSEKSIINGNSTGLINLNNPKYKWAINLRKTMRSNFWIPEKYSMVDDPASYRRLTPKEKDCVDKILSYLIFLDSFQTQNIPRISDYITAPEISACLTLHADQENIHVDSYQYILLSLNLSYEERERIYYLWEKFEPLRKRNQMVMDTFSSFLTEKNTENFFKTLIANYLLEGIYFYVAFMFFYNLSLQNKMVNTSNIIRIIQKDEMTHMVLFENLIRDYLEENDLPQAEAIAHELFRKAVEEETEWGLIVFENQILGFDDQSIIKYLKYLGDNRLQKLGFSPIYGEKENPFTHLERLSQVKGNFFESKVTEYKQSSNFTDWEDW